MGEFNLAVNGQRQALAWSEAERERLHAVLGDAVLTPANYALLFTSLIQAMLVEVGNCIATTHVLYPDVLGTWEIRRLVNRRNEHLGGE